MLQSRGQYVAHFHQEERAKAAFEEVKLPSENHG